MDDGGQGSRATPGVKAQAYTTRATARVGLRSPPGISQQRRIQAIAGWTRPSRADPRLMLRLSPRGNGCVGYADSRCPPAFSRSSQPGRGSSTR